MARDRQEACRHGRNVDKRGSVCYQALQQAMTNGC
jgi:hypothetical protein